MKVRFDRPAYRRRSQVETVVSMIKRRQGAHVHGRSYHSQCRDLRLLVLTHNVMILVVVEVFYRAGQNDFLIVLTLFFFQRYLTSVLAKVGATPTAELEQFLPDVWKHEDAAEPAASS
jgi:hypothetical protein